MITTNPARVSRLLLIGFFLITKMGNAQTTGSLKIQNIKLTIDGKEVTSPDLTLPFEWSKDSKEYQLYTGDQLSIMAKYRISTHKSSRSSVKNSALNVIINYYVTMGEEKDKRRSEKIFYLDQARQFNVEDLFTIKKGYDNSIIKLNYTAALLQ